MSEMRKLIKIPPSGWCQKTGLTNKYIAVIIDIEKGAAGKRLLPQIVIRNDRYHVGVRAVIFFCLKSE